jgi:hypothetical protein
MERERVTSEEAWRRFAAFGDCVIQSVELRVASTPRSAIVELQAQEPPNSDGPWWRVRFEFSGLAEWRFEQIRSDIAVIYSAGVRQLGGLTYVSFDAGDVLDQADDFRATAAYAAAEAVQVTVAPLRMHD